MGIFFVLIILICYGSLYPFDFGYSRSYFDRADGFLTDWRVITRLGDMLGNFALFVPFGAVGMLALVPGRSAAARFILLSLIGFFVAVGVQVLQLYLPSRDPALGDVVWNFCGWTLGSLLVWPARVRSGLLRQSATSIEVVPLGLVLCWVMAELAPFVPSIDLQAYKDSLRALLDGPGLFSVAFLRTYVSWLVLPYMATRLWPEHAGGLWLAAAALGTALAKIVIVQNSLSTAYILALILALASWHFVLRNHPQRILVLVAGLILLLTASALEPFNVMSQAQSFSWVPFSGALSGSMLLNLKAVAGKVFLLGSLLYFLHAGGVRRRVAVGLLFIMVTVLEVAQMWVGDHTSEVTEPLMVLFLGAVLAVFQSAPEQATAAPLAGRPAAAPLPQHSVPPAVPPAGNAASVPPRDSLLPDRRAVALALAGCVAATLIMRTVLGLPQIPYNVRELFGGEDAWWRLFIFCLAGLSIGVGGALVGRLVASSGRVFTVLPGGTLLACLVTYLLLVSSVSAESIWDITGSSNTHWFVMNRHIWGDAGVWFYEAIGSKALIQTVERYVRFVALFGQVVLWLAILSAASFRLAGAAPRGSGSSARLFVTPALTYLLAAIPWLVVFNLIAFKYSSTDNLNELIAGHGHILYFLLILIPANALFVVHAARRPNLRSGLLCVLVVVASLPLGWLLLKYGLSPVVTKYGNTFSGADFLLGPDREELLSDAVLMLRWFVVQGVAVAALALGIQVVPKPSGSKR
jgi:VanZ family protein